MGFTAAVKSCLSKYATFKGRARRSEYWWFHLFFALAYMAGFAVDFALMGNETLIFTLLVFAALLLPSLAVSVRRLHDTGRPGWWLLISFIPFIGGIWLLVLTLLDSELGENKFGPSPKHSPEWNAASTY